MFYKAIFIFCTCVCFSASAQWSLAISSKVERDGKGLSGAKITLYQGTKNLKEITSGSDGSFTIEVPPDGEYVIEVSNPQCNTKKFQVFTRGVPPDVAADKFNPKYKIGGFTMSAPLYSIDYSPLKNPMIKIVYYVDKVKFDHEPGHTEVMLNALGKIRDAEKQLLEKQAAAVKAGDAALKKKDCAAAKTHYEQAISIIPQAPHQDYSVEQLAKCNSCLNADDDAKKLAEEKLQTEKINAENKKLEQEKKEQEKAAQEKIAAANRKKEETDKQLAEERLQSEKLAKENSEKEQKSLQQAQAVKEKLDKEKLAEEEKLKAEQAIADKKKQAETDQKVAEKKKTEKQAAPEVKTKIEKEEKKSEEKIAKVETAKSITESKKVAEPKLEGSTKKGILIPVTSSPNNERRDIGSLKVRHTIPQPLGVDRYKQEISDADEHFKMKRYAEAKKSYSEALKIRPEDKYAIQKIEVISKITSATNK